MTSESYLDTGSTSTTGGKVTLATDRTTHHGWKLATLTSKRRSHLSGDRRAVRCTTCSVIHVPRLGRHPRLRRQTTTLVSLRRCQQRIHAKPRGRENYFFADSIGDQTTMGGRLISPIRPLASLFAASRLRLSPSRALGRADSPSRFSVRPCQHLPEQSLCRAEGREIQPAEQASHSLNHTAVANFCGLDAKPAVPRAPAEIQRPSTSRMV
jgi:hypothetical protein